ncbi:MAG: hypothetical protein K2P99_06070 [Burkholderiales bacterium]|nr:hypothetical protein [Burkholderiales bacterium]
MAQTISYEVSLAIIILFFISMSKSIRLAEVALQNLF